MDISSGDIFPLVFKRIAREGLGEFSLDSNMLSVLMELDGTQNLGQIVKKTNVNVGTMRKIMTRLLQLELVEPVEGAVSMLDDDFFGYLQIQLSLAIGPIAEVLIEDAVIDLGHQPTQFPSHRAAELVDLLAREIQREEKMVIFKQNMVNRIRKRDIEGV
jgi:hypothetical protein